MSVRQTIASTSFFLFLALFSTLAHDRAAAEERWPPWQSYTEAEEAARQKVLKRRAAAAAANNPANIKRQIAQLQSAGKFPQAIRLAQRLLALGEKKGPQSLETADALETLAGLYEAQKNVAEAEPLLKRALDIREKSPGQPGAAATRERLAAAYDALGRSADAQAVRAGAHVAQQINEAPPQAGASDQAKEAAETEARNRAEAERQVVEGKGQAQVKTPVEEPFSIPSADAPAAEEAPAPMTEAPKPVEEAPADKKSAEAPISIPSADGPAAGAAAPAPTDKDAAEAPAAAAPEQPSQSAEAPAAAPPPPAPEAKVEAPELPTYMARRSFQPRAGAPRAAEPPSAQVEAATPPPPPPPPVMVPEPEPQASAGSAAPDSTGEPAAPTGEDDAAVAASPPPEGGGGVVEPQLDGLGVGSGRGAGGGSSAPAAAPPPPPPAAAAPEPAGGAGPPQSPDWQVVPVYWGTDRAVQPNAQRLAFGSDRARKLQLGVADITVPKTHEVPNVERPWVVKIPYFDVTLYAEAEDPKKHFTVKDIKALTKDELLAQVKGRLKSSTAFKDQALVFIHGYNTSFDNALYRTAQIAYDLGFDGAPFLYSWPSGGAVASYTYDRESAQASEPYLRQFLEMVAKETGAKQVSIIAHSMGNQPLMDVLRDMRSAAPEGVEISQVILAAPDVDADSFSNLAKSIKGLASNVTLYVASNDRALIVSRNFWGSYRAGDVPPAGPLVLPGIDTIDVTAASTDVFAINHSGYAVNNKLLGDIAELLKTGLRPPEARSLKPGKITSQAGAYWRYVAPSP